MSPQLESDHELSSSPLGLDIMESDSPHEASRHSQTQTQLEPCTQMESCSQMDCTQSQNDESMTPTPLSPLPVLPWARLVPCMPSPTTPPIELLPEKNEYWLGRSSSKCDIPLAPGTSLSKKESDLLAWAHSMISNRHCRIVHLVPTVPASHRQSPSRQSQDQAASPTPPMGQVYIEDHSGNGTIVNRTTHLRKGDQRLLHSGDEICLVNAQTLSKKIKSGRVLQAILQHYTYIFVATSKAPKRPCVNPRAMNYAGPRADPTRPQGQQASPSSAARRIEAHYEIREVLGDGTSGQVRRAICRQTGQEFAVKVISLRRHVDLSNIDHEVSVMQSLDHPYIIQLIDVFVHPGIAMYLVMELVAGGDLFDRIVQQERYTERDARRVMRRLLAAIHYLHETKNIVHRDLKPENILCESNTHVKLADFGLAKIIQSDGLKTFCGTPQYFAPEVLQRRTTVSGAGRYGKPADMWSLGVILYILLTGRPPFGGELDPLMAYEALDFESDPVWRSIPVARDLVQQLLRLDPKRRLSVRQACAHPWVNTDDGDTHVHPLDDPAITTRKQLFPEATDSATNEVKTDDDSNSVVSKDSVLSKEDFAAAATSHQRDASVNFFNLGVLHEELESCPGMPLDDHQGKRDNKAQHPVTDATPALEESPEDVKSTTAERTVTPHDELVVPRSPLASMDLNDRGNQFREKVLNQTRSGQRSNQANLPQESSSPSNIQSAVTPTASNVRLTNPFLQAHKAVEETMEDPILSQFSSAPSSLQSFPDSPIKSKQPQLVLAQGSNTTKTTSPSQKKRSVPQDDMEEPKYESTLNY
eukprot:Nitzschia sp. Nitz4//scaffold212_size37733//14216//18909//NITZ4_007733-RA/size37733-snap-gene-0.76-mRNA-1//1//CDS//3329542022//5659//frame0